MVQNKSALTPRQHRRRHHRGTYDFANLHIERATLDAAILSTMHQLTSHMHRRCTTSCGICGRDIHPGHTAFTFTTQALTSFLLCYECGQALRLHYEITQPHESPSTPPYGGG